jgi:cytochrome c oxidase assembly protein subunit 15
MGGLQGAIGWWMVKSGLVDDPDVSHYRLAIHLITAFLTFAYTFWVALSLIYPKQEEGNKSFYKQSVLLLIAVLVQIIYGAFVAGLNAGFIINTWPKMNGEWIHSSVYSMTPLWRNFIEGLSGVQFIHRVLAFIIVGIVIYMWVKGKSLLLPKKQLRALYLMLVVIILQILLGIFTLLLAVPIWLGVAHQIGAFILLSVVVYSLSVFKGSAKISG